MNTNAEHNSPQHLVNFILFNNHIISSGFPSTVNALFPTQHFPLPLPVVSIANAPFVEILQRSSDGCTVINTYS